MATSEIEKVQNIELNIGNVYAGGNRDTEDALSWALEYAFAQLGKYNAESAYLLGSKNLSAINTAKEGVGAWNFALSEALNSKNYRPMQDELVSVALEKVATGGLQEVQTAQAIVTLALSLPSSLK